MKDSVRSGLISAAGWLLICSLFFAAFPPSKAHARVIADMAGRNVTVPDTIGKVCTDWPIMMYLVYAIDPTLLAGLNNPLTPQQQKYFPSQVRDLPVVGGFFGQSATTSMETLFKVMPDIVVAEIFGNLALNKKSEKVLEGLGIPVVYVKVDTTDDYPAAFLFLGNLLGRESRGRALADYGRKVFTDTARFLQNIPDAERPSIYYAEGLSGLFTECDTSFHSELIEIAGAKNVHRCPNGLFKVKGRERVSMEQVLRYNPEVIIAAEPAFYQEVRSDPKWVNIPAVRTNRVYLAPRLIFSWFDRPPSFMRLLGIKWMLHRLYPHESNIDIVEETREFYRLFLGVELTEETIRSILDP